MVCTAHQTMLQFWLASGTYNGIAHSDINGTYTSISNITLDSYDITTTSHATATGDVGGATVLQQHKIDYMMC
jgi:hypothetical protein